MVEVGTLRSKASVNLSREFSLDVWLTVLAGGSLSTKSQLWYLIQLEGSFWTFLALHVQRRASTSDLYVRLRLKIDP